MLRCYLAVWGWTFWELRETYLDGVLMTENDLGRNEGVLDGVAGWILVPDFSQILTHLSGLNTN